MPSPRILKLHTAKNVMEFKHAVHRTLSGMHCIPLEGGRHFAVLDCAPSKTKKGITLQAVVTAPHAPIEHYDVPVAYTTSTGASLADHVFLACAVFVQGKQWSFAQ